LTPLFLYILDKIIPHMFEMKIIPTNEGFVYDEAVILHIGRHDFALGAKNKS